MEEPLKKMYRWPTHIGDKNRLPPVRLQVTREANRRYRVERYGKVYGWVKYGRDRCSSKQTDGWIYEFDQRRDTCRHTAPSWKVAVLGLCREYRTHGGGYLHRSPNSYVTSMMYGDVWYVAIQKGDSLCFLPEHPMLTEAKFRHAQQAQGFFEMRLADTDKNDDYHDRGHFHGVEDFDANRRRR